MSANIPLATASLLAKANIDRVGAYTLPTLILQSHMVRGRTYNFITRREEELGIMILLPITAFVGLF